MVQKGAMRGIISSWPLTKGRCLLGSEIILIHRKGSRKRKRRAQRWEVNAGWRFCLGSVAALLYARAGKNKKDVLGGKRKPKWWRYGARVRIEPLPEGGRVTWIKVTKLDERL